MGLDRLKVSIHAPARGATTAYDKVAGKITVSIHAPARGATRLEKKGSFSPSFQSTHPRGVRRSAKYSRTDGACFNPRTREGCDAGSFLV